VVLPGDLAPDKACFARLTNVAMTPFCNASKKTGGILAVLGLGLVGNLTGQVGRLKGFEVIGLEMDPGRAERALACGFDHVIDPSKGDAVEGVRELTGGRGADLVVNATGLTAVFPDSVQMAADGGEISTLGGFRGEFQTDLQPIIGRIHSRHLVLRGGWELQLPMRSAPAQECSSTQMNLRDAMRWLASGAIDLKHIWSHTIKPIEMQTAYECLNAKDENYLGVIVDWQT
jgi:threonine dehydrogenase-like Zn-dependent dehydrogenase